MGNRKSTKTTVIKRMHNDAIHQKVADLVIQQLLEAIENFDLTQDIYVEDIYESNILDESEYEGKLFELKSLRNKINEKIPELLRKEGSDSDSGIEQICEYIVDTQAEAVEEWQANAEERREQNAKIRKQNEFKKSLTPEQRLAMEELYKIDVNEEEEEEFEDDDY